MLPRIDFIDEIYHREVAIATWDGIMMQRASIISGGLR
jgi:hypothetical protein